MSAPHPRVGAVGLELAIHFVAVEVDEDGNETESTLDISGADRLQIFLKKPGSSGASLTKTAVVDTDGTDGVAKYTTVAGDFDTPGNYIIGGECAKDGKVYPAEETVFEVERNRARS